MSEPWTCPSCQFEWVVPVGGECLSCGYSIDGHTLQRLATEAPGQTGRVPSGGDREERGAVSTVSTQEPRELVSRDDPLAPLYPPGVYPPPVAEPPVVNGESTRGMADPRPLTEQSRIAWPNEQEAIASSARMVEDNAKLRLAGMAQQQAFLSAMTAARARIDALQHELSVQEQQVKEAVAAESEVRASLAQHQEAYTQLYSKYNELSAQLLDRQRQLVQVAEANQQLRAEQAKWLASTRPGLSPYPGDVQPDWPDHLPSRTVQPKGQWQERRVDALEKQLGHLSALLDTIVMRLDREQAPAPEASPETYATFITTDSQAARVEQEILRSQAQYNQPWRG